MICAFALAQPVFELLASDPTFFVVRRSERIDLWLLVIALLLPVPIVLAGVVWLVTKLSDKAGNAVYLTILAGLVCLITLPLFKTIESWPDTAVWLSAAAAGALFAGLYSRAHWARQFVSLAAIALLLFPWLFLYQTSAAFPAQSALFEGEAKSTTPVTLLVLDELSSTTLMDPNRQIDAVRYPNLAEFAAQSHWFRNATTVADSTTDAVPAIFTGKFPGKYSGSEKPMPINSQMPLNLFTFLHRSHNVNAVESVTWLCHAQICGGEKTGLAERLSFLLNDTLYIYLQIVLPRQAAKHFPSISQTWAHFNEDNENEVIDQAEMGNEILKASLTDDTKKFNAFIDSIVPASESSSRPTANILHIVFPHLPYQHLPSGQKYNSKGREPGLEMVTGAWADDEWAVRQHYQRYLLQLQYLDKLIGRLMNRLKTSGLYDASLIALVSDHGVSFRPGTFRRRLTPENYTDILPVLFMAKLPFQKNASVTDRNVETIDVLPTIAEGLGLTLPFTVDGNSALSTQRPARKTKKALRGDTGEVLTFNADMEEKYERLRWQLDKFGYASDDVFTVGPLQHFVGEPTTVLHEHEAKAFNAIIENEKAFKNIKLARRKLTARVVGYIEPANLANPAHIAISVNGIVRAMTKTHLKQEGKIRFTAMLPPDALKQGKNVVKATVLRETH